MHDKIKPTHLQRSAYVYVRQSTAAQVHYNRESTDRQYKLTERALRLGWPEPQIKVVDEDLARSGSGTSDRHGFTTMTTEVALLPRRAYPLYRSIPGGPQQCGLVPVIGSL